jgi:hypothetical protein
MKSQDLLTSGSATFRNESAGSSTADFFGHQLSGEPLLDAAPCRAGRFYVTQNQAAAAEGSDAGEGGSGDPVGSPVA